MLSLISYQLGLSLIKFRKENATPSQLSVHILSSELEGNAEELGVDFGKRITAYFTDTSTCCAAPSVFLWGGESTVRFPTAEGAVPATAKGGRNQEMVLSALKYLREFASNNSSLQPTRTRFAFFSLGTDGQLTTFL